MSFQIRYTKGAQEDLERLFDFLLEIDLDLAEQAIEAIEKTTHILQDFPFTCRKAQPDNTFVRELIIPFGAKGYVALFEIENNKTVTILAVRHQREDDYY
jgi:plasmid stabilization system protein ParE